MKLREYFKIPLIKGPSIMLRAFGYNSVCSLASLTSSTM